MEGFLYAFNKKGGQRTYHKYCTGGKEYCHVAMVFKKNHLL